MATTENYGLKKPLTTDYYDVEAQNENMNRIDQALKGNTDDISAEAATRADADTALENLISNEVAVREAADTALLVTATTAANGLMSATDKAKLDGVANNANNYVHPTTAGNKHVPDGGSFDSILGYSASGTAIWIQQLAAKSLLSATLQSHYGGLTTVEAALKNAVKKDNVVVLTASGTWTPPRANMLIDIFMISGGGGGGRGYTGVGGGGAGGLAKFIAGYKIHSATPIPVVVGAGGIGSTTTGVSGGDGGVTSFGVISTIKGGQGGKSAVVGAGGAGGAGGGGAGYEYGGDGASGYGGDGSKGQGGADGGGGELYPHGYGGYCPLNGVLYGGAGGGGATNDPNPAVGGAGGAGGGGRGGDSTHGTSLLHATNYGGGGGGSYKSNQGGNGYQGVIIIGYNS
jgi:hypothetical protein